MRPTRRTILIAAAGFGVAIVVALAGGRVWALWVVGWGLLAVGLGLDLLRLPRSRSLTCELEAPDTVYVGEPATATLALGIAAGHEVAFEAIVDVSDSLRNVNALRGKVGPGGVRLVVPIDARRRGLAAIEAVSLRYAGPLGLLQGATRFRFDREVAVVPNVLPVRRAALRFLSARHVQAGLKIEKYKGDGTEFDSLREFVEGDDSRTIHWRASARHRTMLCRQFRAERNHQVVLAIDSGRLMSEPLGAGIPKVDHAVTAALLMACIGLKSGDRVGLASFDANVRLFAAPQGGMGHYRTLVQLSAAIDYSDAETNFTLGLTTITQRLRRRSLVVVLTDFVDTVTAELMVDNLARMARRHVVVFVTLRDPELERLAHDRPDSVLTMNRAVVAYTYLHDRRVVLRRLERIGLHTVDAEPQRMGPELINRYLDIKRRELI